MKIISEKILQEPVGRIMGKISKILQSNLQTSLAHLDIDRSFYPLLLIESRPGVTQQELASELLCDKVQVVRIINYLSSNGYVERVKNKTDRRKQELLITEKARRFIPEIRQSIIKTSAFGLKDLNDEQIETLYNLLETIESKLVKSK